MTRRTGRVLGLMLLAGVLLHAGGCFIEEDGYRGGYHNHHGDRDYHRERDGDRWDRDHERR